MELICIVCPKGCKLIVSKENDEYKVTGNFCKRGVTYGINEVVSPKRWVTSTVRIKGAIYQRLPVITDKEVPKNLVFKVMDEINKIVVVAPVKYRDVLIENVLNTGCNVVASKTMNECL